MTRILHAIALVSLLTYMGCGKTEVAETPVSAQTTSQTAAAHPSPTDVVSQFLDQVRRGGEDSGAGQLLTERARQELARIGRSIQPIGSPDAAFEVTRAEAVEEGSALVHSIWSEPKAEGGRDEFQVVWAVEKESVGWRISGLAMQLEEDAEPIIMDFENAEMMAQMFGTTGSETESGSKSSQAAAAPAGSVR